MDVRATRAVIPRLAPPSYVQASGDPAQAVGPVVGGAVGA